MRSGDIVLNCSYLHLDPICDIAWLPKNTGFSIFSIFSCWLHSGFLDCWFELLSRIVLLFWVLTNYTVPRKKSSGSVFRHSASKSSANGKHYQQNEDFGGNELLLLLDGLIVDCRTGKLWKVLPCLKRGWTQEISKQGQEHTISLTSGEVDAWIYS